MTEIRFKFGCKWRIVKQSNNYIHLQTAESAGQLDILDIKYKYHKCRQYTLGRNWRLHCRHFNNWPGKARTIGQLDSRQIFEYRTEVPYKAGSTFETVRQRDMRNEFLNW